jgi:hypothetical protein
LKEGITFLRIHRAQETHENNRPSAAVTRVVGVPEKLIFLRPPKALLSSDTDTRGFEFCPDEIGKPADVLRRFA